jgi:hypothetical protein
MYSGKRAFPDSAFRKMRRKKNMRRGIVLR